MSSVQSKERLKKLQYEGQGPACKSGSSLDQTNDSQGDTWTARNSEVTSEPNWRWDELKLWVEESIRQNKNCY